MFLPILQVEKEVEYSDDEYQYEPEQGYDPSTYEARYKRQASRPNRQRGQSSPQNSQSRQGGKRSKKPMTCYVCEDEQGRYAERCSYGSDGSPDNGNTFYHSESTSFTDNGRRPG